MKKIAVIIGTRPEAVKLMPVLRALREKKELTAVTLLTGQHTDPGYELFSFLGITPLCELSVMQKGQNLSSLVTKAVTQLSAVLTRLLPDGVIVHGDTASAFAGALAAFHLGIPVFHVEAGLRTYDIARPFPEEGYRTAIAAFATLHFCPTPRAEKALLMEGKPRSRVVLTGNTVVDALRITREAEETRTAPPATSDERRADAFAGGKTDRLCLFSVHRRENGENEARAAYRAARRLLSELPNLYMACTVFPTPLSRALSKEYFGPSPRVLLLPPVGVFCYHRLLRRSYMIMTDSGGVQEEGSACHKPVCVLRESTERPEGLESGSLLLVGTEEESVYRAGHTLFTKKTLYRRMQAAKNPFGDGYAAERIANAICRYFTLK